MKSFVRTRRYAVLGTFAGKFSTTWSFGINDAGVVVGQSTFQDTYHAFVYRNGMIKDLNTLIPGDQDGN